MKTFKCLYFCVVFVHVVFNSRAVPARGVGALLRPCIVAELLQFLLRPHAVFTIISDCNKSELSCDYDTIILIVFLVIRE